MHVQNCAPQSGSWFHCIFAEWANRVTDRQPRIGSMQARASCMLYNVQAPHICIAIFSDTRETSYHYYYYCCFHLFLVRSKVLRTHSTLAHVRTAWSPSLFWEWLLSIYSTDSPRLSSTCDTMLKTVHINVHAFICLVHCALHTYGPVRSLYCLFVYLFVCSSSSFSFIAILW